MAGFLDPDAVRLNPVRFSRHFKSIENKENDMLSSKQISKITELKASGLSERKISKKTGINRETVSKYLNPKTLKPILQRNETRAEKIETIKEEIRETRQDSKAIRKELKRARKQQDRAENTHYFLEDEAENEEAEEELQIKGYSFLSEIRKPDTQEIERQEQIRREIKHRSFIAKLKWRIEHPEDRYASLTHKLLIAMALRR